VRKAVSKLELPETQFERTVKDQIACRTTWIKKMIILSKFLESWLNFLFSNLEKTVKIWYSQG